METQELSNHRLIDHWLDHPLKFTRDRRKGGYKVCKAELEGESRLEKAEEGIDRKTEDRLSGVPT